MGAHDRDPGGVRGALIRLGDATAWLFAATFAIGVYEVVVRYAFNAPTNWVHVTSTALCVVAFAIAGGTAMAQDQHLRVTVLADRLRGPWQRAAQALALACGALYLLGLAWGLAREAWQSLLRFDGPGGAWSPELTPGPPNWPLPAFAKALLLVGALLFLVAVIDAAWRLARRVPD